MSSCFSGGGRTYAFELDIVKSPSTSTRTSQTSSPSSTLSESSNSALAISTRKPRTPRKRPNQTYNEAAALLSTAYPNIFSTKILTNPRKSAKPHDPFLDSSSSSELLLPFRLIDNSATFLLHNPILEKPSSRFEPKAINPFEKSCNSPGEFNSPVNFDSNPNSSMEICDDFDAESMLDEEIEEGIDSIMGSSTTSMNIDSVDDCSTTTSSDQMMMKSCYGYPMGLGFGGNFGFGFRGGVRPLRQVDDGVNWWSFPTVDVLEISPRFNKSRPSVPSTSPPKSAGKKKKKMEKLAVVESKLTPVKEKSQSPTKKEKEEEEEPESEQPGQLMLKLDYDDVLSAWSDKASPFPEELQGGGDGNDVSARLAQIDLFTDAGGLREASVLRYKEKRRTRLFSKKIRYQVRKVNADRRPRMKICEKAKL
ncbi:protein CHLOROPLAST IMPORT APPARATUS 2 isoform X2 [Argentina anserina]|uniref:protein CHLOROPLAST IMPORT APPARATUS 2 isoform X2 n=1 Tax=Argentina anserina TaxID=57926 RepID=UPI0021766A86|nr:protein CHLOROPLAST IMPORT APPARATUS 2 isoform X2 [Potentilla anserina]